MAQRRQLEWALDEMRSTLAKRANGLIMGMAIMHLPPTDHQNHHQFLPPPPLASPYVYASASSVAPLLSNSFLSGYNPDSMTIPFINDINASMGASSHVQTILNAGHYFLSNQFIGQVTMWEDKYQKSKTKNAVFSLPTEKVRTIQIDELR